MEDDHLRAILYEELLGQKCPGRAQSVLEQEVPNEAWHLVCLRAMRRAYQSGLYAGHNGGYPGGITKTLANLKQ